MKSAQALELEFNRAIACHREGRHDWTEKLCRDLHAHLPTHPGINHLLALALHFQGRLVEAADYYRQALAQAPGHPQILADWGACLHLLGRLDEAEAAYRQAIASKDDVAAFHYNLGTVLLDRGKAKAATKPLRRALDLEPSHVGALFNLGRAHEDLGQTKDALNRFRQCLDLDPADANGAARRIAHLKGGPVPERFSPEGVRAYYDLKAGLWDAGKTEERGYKGLAMIERAIEAALGATKGLDILDAGCGTGLLGPILRRRAKWLVGLDLSPNMIAQARAKGMYDTLLAGDLINHFGSGPSYHLIAAGAVFIHFADLVPVLTAAKAALRPKGVIAFTVFTQDAPGVMPGETAFYRHNPAHVTEAAARAGLDLAYLAEDVHEVNEGVGLSALAVALRKSD
ncbi:MAG: tetratricopeptide repeat protein [Rhodospirillales bacterium]|nr:tetratricopeptide repeat protein [Rhodospirillales bacterium]